MSKSISISIRVSEEDLMKLKQAARLEAYASCTGQASARIRHLSI